MDEGSLLQGITALLLIEGVAAFGLFVVLAWVL